MPNIKSLVSFQDEILFFNVDNVAMVKAAKAPQGCSGDALYSLVYLTGSLDDGWLVKGSAVDVTRQLGWV